MGSARVVAVNAYALESKELNGASAPVFWNLIGVREGIVTSAFGWKADMPVSVEDVRL